MKKELKQKILGKSELGNFLFNLTKKHRIYIPVKNRVSEFSEITSKEDLKKIFLDKITEIPAKKILIPENENLLKNKEQNLIQNQKTIIFGLKKCDLNAISVIDNVMKEANYVEKRNNTTLIGIYCENPDKYCFCESMQLTDFYDLFFWPYKKNYYISIGSEKGFQLVKNLPDAKNQIKLRYKNSKKLNTLDIERNYRNKIWETDAEKCLSCSACTVYCPTCNCFDIQEKTSQNFKENKKIRTSASCQLKSFSEVSGGKIFRESRLARFKHFVYHKIVYYKKDFARPMCVGCGRCLRVCPTKIDWVDTINLLNNTKSK